MKRALLTIALLTGCTDWGPVVTEPAEVDSLAFVPEGHGTGTGFSSSGNVAVTFVDVPARYAVVFRCQHGKFVVQGADERHKNLWQRLREHDPVTVYFRQEVGGTGLDFVNAEKRATP